MQVCTVGDLCAQCGYVFCKSHGNGKICPIEVGALIEHILKVLIEHTPMAFDSDNSHINSLVH